MKRIAYLGFLFGVLLAFSSCSEIEEDVDVNVVSNGDTPFTIAKGFKYLYAETVNDNYKYNVYLMDKNVNFADTASGYIGIGSLIKFTLFSNDDFDVAPGTYTIDAFNSNDVYTAVDCGIYHNYDFAADTGRYCNITGGIAEFINEGATIKIRLDLVVDHSNTEMFSGTFQGVLGNAPR